MKLFIKYVLILAICTACNNTVKPKFSNELLDTIKTKPAGIAAKPLLFETAFIKGTTAKIKDATLDLYGINIGNIKISSGRVIACDPLLIEEYGKPFTQAFPTGAFPFQLSIARYGEGESIAFARILFSNEPVARWEVALLANQQPVAVGDEDAPGYIVDSGIGSFMDDEAGKALDKKTVTRMDGAVYAEMNKHRHSSWRYALYHFGNYNIAAFTSGEGDGRYTTYIGFDVKGTPCRLVTDFGLFDWNKD